MVTDLASVAVRMLMAAVDAPTVSTGWFQTIGLTLVALTGSYFAYRQATRVARISATSAATTARAVAETEAKRIESGAYERAKDLMESGMAQQTVHLERVERALAAEQQQSERLRRRIAELEDEVARQRRKLIVAGLDDTSSPGTG